MFSCSENTGDDTACETTFLIRGGANVGTYGFCEVRNDGSCGVVSGQFLSCDELMVARAPPSPPSPPPAPPPSSPPPLPLATGAIRLRARFWMSMDNLMSGEAFNSEFEYDIATVLGI